MPKKGHRASKYALSLSFLFLAFFVVEGVLILGMIWILKYLNIFKDQYILYVAAAILGSIILGFISSFFINKYIMKNVDRFKEVIIDIANGNFDVTEEKLSLPLYKDISDEFNKMVKEINSSYILKRDFASSISHEFKTPLVSILGYAELLKDDSITNEEKNAYLDIIISEVKRLSNITNETMILTRLETTEILKNVAPFRVDSQIEECILLLDNELKNKNINVDLSMVNAKILANKDLFKEVWLNLLTNAIKYSNNDTVIKISSEIDQEFLVVKVKDQGIGMDEETITNLFDKYYRGTNHKSIPGIGLGLAITKKIVEMSEGTINVESKVGNGSTFTVKLPICKD